jgi:hypothetical protein
MLKVIEQWNLIIRGRQRVYPIAKMGIRAGVAQSTLSQAHENINRTSPKAQPPPPSEEHTIQQREISDPLNRTSNFISHRLL